MGCDIHITIQRQDDDCSWREVRYQSVWQYDGAPKALDAIPIAPDSFLSRNYDTFAILADVRNGVGFAGIKMGEGWPSIAPDRGFPPDFDAENTLPSDQDDEPKYMGDHSFTWVGLDELKAFDWDGTLSWLYGCVPADEYERLSAVNERPHGYCGGISGPGIRVYEPDAYKAAKATSTLCARPYVRMGWPMSAREATRWPDEVIPWLESLADGHPLRLVLGFDS